MQILESDRRDSARTALEAPRYTGGFEWSFLEVAGLDRFRLPHGLTWERMVAKDAFNVLTLLTVYVMIAYALVSTLECVRGLPPGMSANPMLFVLVVAVLWTLYNRLYEIGRKRSEVQMALYTGIALTTVSCVAMLWIYQSSPAAYPVASSFGAGAAVPVATPSPAAAAELDEHGNEIAASPVAAAGATQQQTPSPLPLFYTEPLPFLDLGASLRYGLGNAVSKANGALVYLLGPWINIAAPSPDADASGSIGLGVWVLLISSILGATCAFLFPPALRVAKLFHAVTSDAAMMKKPLTQAWVYIWFYWPLIVSVLWVRPLIADRMVPRTLARCSATSIARDCSVLPVLNATSSASPDSGLPSIANPSPSPAPSTTGDALYDALPRLTGVAFTETQWLQIRIGMVVLFALYHMFSIRSMLAVALQSGRDDQVTTVAKAAAEAPNSRVRMSKEKLANLSKSGPLQMSGYTPDELNKIEYACAVDASRSILSITLVGLQLLAVPALLLSLALLTVRLGGLDGGLGVCTACSAGLEAAGLGSILRAVRATGPPKADAIEKLLDILVYGVDNAPSLQKEAVAGGIGSVMASSKQALTVLTSAFWRPVLSYSLFFILVSFFLMQEFGYVYFRYVQPSIEAEAKTIVTGAAAAGAADGAAAGAAVDDKKKQDKKKR